MSGYHTRANFGMRLESFPLRRPPYPFVYDDQTAVNVGRICGSCICESMEVTPSDPQEVKLECRENKAMRIGEGEFITVESSRRDLDACALHVGWRCEQRHESHVPVLSATSPSSRPIYAKSATTWDCESPSAYRNAFSENKE